MGFNAHAANVVAAMFIACGQDAAHAIDGRTLYDNNRRNGDRRVCCRHPAVAPGSARSVAGRGVDTQNECLKILGVAVAATPPGANAKKFAEIVGAGVLAGELSLIGALAAQHLARAHQELGRGVKR